MLYMILRCVNIVNHFPSLSSTRAPSTKRWKESTHFPPPSPTQFSAPTAPFATHTHTHIYTSLSPPLCPPPQNLPPSAPHSQNLQNLHLVLPFSWVSRPLIKFPRSTYLPINTSSLKEKKNAAQFSSAKTKRCSPLAFDNVYLRRHERRSK